MFVFQSEEDILPWKLWAAIGSLLVVDMILLTVWSAVDPLDRLVEPSFSDRSL